MNKKSILALIVATILILSLVGCKKVETKVSQNDTTVVESTDQQSKTQDNSEENKTSTTKDNSQETETNTKSTEVDKRTEVQGVSVIYPSSWIKKTIKGEDIYILDNKGTNVNLVVESMQGYSEEEYNAVSDKDVKTNLNVDNIQVKEHEFNNKKARITYYVQKNGDKNLPTYQVTFLNNNMSYIFTIGSSDKISDENMQSFDNMLNTIEFVD